jgi:hypothetical protein
MYLSSTGIQVRLHTELKADLPSAPRGVITLDHLFKTSRKNLSSTGIQVRLHIEVKVNAESKKI